MGVRHWLMMVMGTALLLAACTSPGEPFAYHDLKVSLGPTSDPAQPATSQTSTLSFTLRNTWNQPVANVKWVLRDTTDPLNVLEVVPPDTVAVIEAFDRVVIDVALPTQSAGKRTYEVTVDPDNTEIEEDETNNTSETLTVVVADQDIAFSGTPIVTLGSPPPESAQDFTIAFTLTNTLHAAATGPGSAIPVSYAITDADDVVVTPVSPAGPLTVSVPGGTTGTPGTATVTLIMPATGSAGTFVYTITLWPAGDSNGDDGNPGNNTITVRVVIPANS